MKPSDLFAFATVFLMCVCQFRLELIFTPRYGAVDTVSKTVPLKLYLFNSGFRPLLMFITLHLEGLKDMPQSSSH